MNKIYVSLNEIDAICKKGLRGAGYPWGLAEEAAKANKWMSEKGFLGLNNLAMLLDKKSKKNFITTRPNLTISGWCLPEQYLCPILTACTVIDFFTSNGLPASMRNVLFPMQMVGILGMFAEKMEISMMVRWQGASMILGPRYCVFSGTIMETELADKVHLETIENIKGHPVDAQIWASLKYYSSLTHVSKSAVSSRGAGAGMSDND